MQDDQAPLSLPDQPAGEFIPLRGLATALTLLLAAVIAMVGERLLIETFSMGSRSWQRTFIGSDLDKAIDITAFVTAVVFVNWFRRARINAESSDWPQRRARGWTFWGWIVPIVNLWIPFQLMGDIWRAGLPASRRRKTAWLPVLWWATWLSWSGIGVSGEKHKIGYESPHLTPDTARISLCLLVVAGLALIAIIRRVSAGPLGRPGPMP